MRIPLKIAARHVALTAPDEAEVRVRADRLEQFFDRILGCRVVVEGPGGHHGKGRHSVRIVIRVPTRELAVTRQGDDRLDTAIGAAFDAAERRLEDYARRLRGDVKARLPASEDRT
jgi:ribosome-associated translation inhibitor RaiA